MFFGREYESRLRQQTLLFDLDDTLIYCNKYFYDVIQRFAERLLKYLNECGASKLASISDIKQKQLELDMRGIQRSGFAKERFPESLIETYHYYRDTIGLITDSALEDELYQLGMKVYDQTYEPYPHMFDTLEELKDEGHKLHLYTGGDMTIQTFKVNQLGLERYFGDRMYVATHKTTSFMNRIIQDLQLDRQHTWMIGNSARTDVVPALQSGIHAIYIPIKDEWAFNVVDISERPQGAFLTLDSLQQVPKAIREYRNQD